ncbi:MAG: hypothetical protein ACKO9A_06140, partial [Alphaproteobacteria bacterium]
MLHFSQSEMETSPRALRHKKMMGSPPRFLNLIAAQWTTRLAASVLHIHGLAAALTVAHFKRH